MLMACFAVPAIAQQSARPAAVVKKADLSGVWNLVGGGGGGQAAFKSNPHSDWSHEALPFTPQGLAVFETSKPGKGPRQIKPALGNDPIGGANPPGLYRTLVYSRPFEFVQAPGKIIQMFEWGRIWRVIYTDGRQVPDDVPTGPYWYGYSVGRWEGDTLVVTTVALDERAWLDEWGTRFSDRARIEERWQAVAPGKLQMTITVNDPAYYTRPWTSMPINYTLEKKGVEPGEIIFAPMDENAFNESIRDPAGLPAKK